MLDGGKADLTIGVPPAPAGRILNARLVDERFVCIMLKDHPAAGSDLDLESFLSLSHLLVSPENERFGVVDVALTKMGRKRRLVLTLPHMYAAPALIASSDMIATIIEGVVSASGHPGKLDRKSVV